MPTFTIYDLETGDVVTSAQFENPADAGRHREALQAETGRPLCSLVPLNPEVDAAHIRLMVDSYRLSQEVSS